MREGPTLGWSIMRFIGVYSRDVPCLGLYQHQFCVGREDMCDRFSYPQPCGCVTMLQYCLLEISFLDFVSRVESYNTRQTLYRLDQWREAILHYQEDHPPVKGGFLVYLIYLFLYCIFLKIFDILCQMIDAYLGK